MPYTLSKASRDKLKGVHPDLVKVTERAIEITAVDFKVLEGKRTLARQKMLAAAGASQVTTTGRHLTGKAIDVGALLNGKIEWHWPLYAKIAKAFKQAAKELGIPIIWGGDWTTLKDGGHFELPRKYYP